MNHHQIVSLQSDIVDVLVKFKKPVALAGDVSQMYHQILLRPVDRPLHIFLYRNLGSGDTPKVYDFKRLVFGGCYCTFCVQFAWHTMPEFTRKLTHCGLMQL